MGINDHCCFWDSFLVFFQLCDCLFMEWLWFYTVNKQNMRVGRGEALCVFTSAVLACVCVCVCERMNALTYYLWCTMCIRTGTLHHIVFTCFCLCSWQSRSRLPNMQCHTQLTRQIIHNHMFSKLVGWWQEKAGGWLDICFDQLIHESCLLLLLLRSVWWWC